MVSSPYQLKDVNPISLSTQCHLSCHERQFIEVEREHILSHAVFHSLLSAYLCKGNEAIYRWSSGSAKHEGMT